MATTIAPSTEAMKAIRDRINSWSKYVLMFRAEYSESNIDPLADIDSLKVDVCSDTEEQLAETLDADRTTHQIVVWVRQQVNDSSNKVIDDLKLLTRQIYDRLNNYDTTNGRVRIWEIDANPKEVPDKEILRTQSAFVARIDLRVEVEAS